MNRCFPILLGAAALSACATSPDPILPGTDSLLPPMRVAAGGEIIDVGPCVAHAGPRLEDFDGDGTQDLLVGDFVGHVHVHLNTGTNESPMWAEGQVMEANGEVVKIPNW